MRLAVFNQKGGVGKTTTALNLGAAIARRKGDALLIDLDPQAHLSAIHSNARHGVERSVFAYYQNNTPLSALEITWKPIGHLIPAHPELVKVDSLFGKGPNILNKLNQAITEYESARPNKSVVIDCCPFLGVLALNAVFAADRVLIPVSSDFLSLRGAQQIEHTLRALEPVLKKRLERRYLLTRFDRRRKMCFEILERMRAQFGGEVCETVISENVAVAESPSVNRDIFSHEPNSRGARDYRNLLDELTDSNFLSIARISE
ncbi:MAG TPA: ParA family protein [Rhodocyclaceae bacterium]